MSGDYHPIRKSVIIVFTVEISIHLSFQHLSLSSVSHRTVQYLVSNVVQFYRYLGLLNYLYVWHDNTGRGSSASWFLKCIIVRDLQTNQVFYFIAQRWLAVEKDDGKVR